MAAYAALTSLSETTELLLHKINLQKTTDDDDGVHRSSSRNTLLQQLQNEIESLRENTDFLLSDLEESPTHPFEAQMKDAADQAQVIIGRFVLDQLRPEFTVDDDDVILESLSHQLQRIHEDLITSMVDKIKNNASDETNKESVGIFDSSLSRSKYPLRNGKAFSSTWEVLHELGNYLFVDSSAELRVVSVLGMGGIGKTTVARMFYNYGLRSELFEVTGWVTVSQDLSARDILVSLLASIKPYITQPKQRNESIENHIHKNLKGRRFLIVLDDVWSPEALRLLMSAFPDDGNGSGIVITTRKEEVAAVETNPKRATHTVNMRFLNPDESCELLWSEVFEDENCPDELEDISRNIVMVCEGLPLAIVLVAGILLASNKSLHEWNYVFENLNVDYESRDEMVETVLSLSYKHLPHRLRTCLLYMGAFPEDYEINVARLTKQLSAQGFDQHKSTSYEVEQCLQYLGNRNLVSVPVWKYDNLGIKRVCLHDTVREFCLKKAREEKFLHCVTEDDDSDHDLTGRKIKVGFNLNNLKRICNSDDADYDTHTIMCFGRGWTRTRHLISIGRFKLLKSLDLVNVEIESLPNEILNLFLLRLLALGHVPELPPSISNLQYLETLIVNDAKDPSSSSSLTTIPRILCVPFEIWTMSQLRHFVSFCCGPLPSPDKEENSPLQNLETLNAVMNLDCSEDLIEMIPNVKKLGLFYFGVERATHSIENIERLSRLEKLKVWVMVPFSSPQNLNLGFPTTLRKLTLRGIRLSHGDMSAIGQLPRLRLLKLIRNDFERDEWRITTTNGFERLEILLLEESGLRHWSCDGGNGSLFPMLDVLAIRTCNELNEIENVVQNVPSLKILMVLGCKNKSLVESANRIKQSNENLNVAIRKYGC